jgi:Domain of unknown function (DUF4328)
VEGWPSPSGSAVPPAPEGPRPPRANEAGYRPLRTRATLTRVTLALMTLACIVAVVFDVAERSLVARVGSGEPVDFAELAASDDRQLAISLVQGALWIFGAAFFIAWLHRAYRNLEALGAEGLRYGPGWAIGAWFVPILNLFRPAQIVRDVWRGSHPYLADPLAWRDTAVPLTFALWWAAHLLSGVFGGIGGSLRLSAEEAADLEVASALYIAADSLTAVAAVLAFVVVDRTTARQAASAARAFGKRQDEPVRRWLHGRGRAAVAAALCAGAAGVGALALAAQQTPATEVVPAAQPETTTSTSLYSFTDDFSDPATGWVVQENEDVSYAYENGEYRIAVTSPQMNWFSLLRLPTALDSMELEADVRLARPAQDEAAVGLGCFVTDLYGYFATISPDGYWLLGIDPEDTEQLALLDEGYAVGAVGSLTAPTRMALRCESGPPAIVTLSVDGGIVAEARHDAGLGTFSVAALLAASGSGSATAHFDDFVLGSPSGR